MKNKMLSQSIADNILSMITIEKRFSVGDKLPNELELSEELNVSRTTLREAIRILVAYDILEIRRGKGTYVAEKALEQPQDLEQLSSVKVNAKDLYEMRLIFEPEAAYLAAIRGTDAEIKRIADYGKRIENEIKSGKDRTKDEHAFHKAIAQATHNEFMNKLMPILYQAISKGVVLSVQSEKAINDTIGDHRMIMEFLEQRNAEGAKNAMRMLMQFIDVSTWERAMHYEVFRNSVQPQYCVTFDADVTNFLSYVKKRNDSFTFSFVYAVTKCANEIQAFRCRFVDGKPAIFETIHTSFTYLNRDTELFKVVNVPMQEKMEDYVALAKKTEENQTEYFTAPMANDIYQFSSFPWVSYTHISHTESGRKDNATPLFDWRKFYEKNGKIWMPLSVQVHHSFVDGVHIGKFAEKLQCCLDGFE